MHHIRAVIVHLKPVYWGEGGVATRSSVYCQVKGYTVINGQ